MVLGAVEITGVPVGGPLQAVVIGASAGGPPALEKILRALPKEFSVPVCVCLHLPLGFTATYAAHLDGMCGVRVKEAEGGEALVEGTVYVAPIGRHLRLARTNGAVTARLDPDFSDSLHVPSIDMLFSSAVQAYGSRLLAVLLTGMGADGALGMLAARRAGAYTIAESEETAFQYSMPGSAVELGAVAEQCRVDDVARVMCERVAGRY